MQSDILQTNSIFEQPWWLDIVAPGNWESLEIENSGRIVARLPIVKSKRFGFKCITMPLYTQTLGYWIENTGAKNAKRYSKEKDLLTELIEKIPKGYNVDIMLDHSCEYLFPFFWNDYDLKMHYSYRIEDLSDQERIWAGFGDNIRTDIRKARNKVAIEENHPIEDLLMIQRKTFERQGRELNNTEPVIRQLDESLKEHDARKYLCAVDAQGNIHAAAYFVFDSKCCYYLIGGGDPQWRNSGAGSLLIWEGIKYAADVSHAFDFEGSMIESVERNFRAFGGKPTPYWQVTKFNFPLMTMEHMKPRIKKMIGWK